MNLKDLQPTTEIDNAKTWNMLKIGDYFYAFGIDSLDVGYEYIAKILKKSYNDLDENEDFDAQHNWVCIDIWNAGEVSEIEGAWTMEKSFFISGHISFHILDMKEFPEYLL
ncbi:MAG: hypothetical protein J7L15_03670 [Clostridiales bacterium]|nr:hypothetical protein [Clostridiales bacterium]